MLIKPTICFEILKGDSRSLAPSVEQGFVFLSALFKISFKYFSSSHGVHAGIREREPVVFQVFQYGRSFSFTHDFNQLAKVGRCHLVMYFVCVHPGTFTF